MYGPDKKWMELMREMENDINEARDKRGAGEKPKLTKYDPNFKLDSSQDYM
jgi:hypothetical protein